MQYQRHRMYRNIERSKHQRNRAEQLNQYVQRWTSRILERITHRIPHHTSHVRLAFLTQHSAIRIETISHFTLGIHAQVAGFDVLLGIVPGTTTIIQEEGKDNTAHCANHKHTGFGLRAKNDTDCYGSQDSYQTW